MKYIITDCGKKVAELTYFQFVDWYYNTFGTDCGDPRAIRDSLLEDRMTYLGRGFSVTAQTDAGINPHFCRTYENYKGESYCAHSKKYRQKFQTFEFDYCPDCKKEV